MNDLFSIQRWFQPHLPNPAMLLMLLAREGYSVQQWNERPGMLSGVQKFDGDKSHWVVSGSIEITIAAQVGMTGQVTYTLGVGDRDFIKAGTYFSKRILGDEMVLYLTGEKLAPKEIVESPTVESPSVLAEAETKKVSAGRTKGKKGTKKTKGKNEKTTNSRRAKRK